MKKIILVILISFGAVAIAYGIYFYFNDSNYSVYTIDKSNVCYGDFRSTASDIDAKTVKVSKTGEDEFVAKAKVNNWCIEKIK